MIYTIMAFAGPQWDIMVRSLLGKTIVNYFTHGVSAQDAFIGEFYNNQLFYFEPYREPVSDLLFALLSTVFTNTIFPYIVVTYVLYIIAFYKLSKELKIDTLIAFSVFLNSFMAYFLFLPNGGEALSVVFASFALLYLLRKSALSGVFLALSMLSKYPAIALLPLVLLLGDKKKILKGIALEAIVLGLWSLFDYAIYGNPFYSYIESIANSNVVSTASSINVVSLLTILAYPVLIALIGICVLYYKRQKIKIKLDYTTKLLISLIVLTAVECIVIIPHNDPATQARYGYLISMALLIPAALILNRASQKAPKLKYAVAIAAILLLAYIVCSAYINADTQNTVYYSTQNPNGIYAHAYSELGALGYGDCRFVSNAWIPMLYSGYDSYSPFIIYPSPTITPIVKQLLQKEGLVYDTYVQEEESYPIIAFKYTGVEESFIVNLNQSRLAYSDANVSIYLPANAACYKD